MPERLSRLIRTKLLRRSSTSAVPEVGAGADPGVDPNSDSLCIPSMHLLSRDEALRSQTLRHYSIASSLPADLPRSIEDLAPPAAKTGRRASRATIGPSEKTDEDDEGPGGPDDRRSIIDRVTRGKERICSTPEPQQSKGKAFLSVPAADAASPAPRTPSIEPAFPSSSTSTSPLRSVSRHGDVSSVQPVGSKTQEPAADDSSDRQLTPSLDPVAESPSRNTVRTTSSLPPTTSGTPKRPGLPRRQSLLPASQQHLVNGLLSQNGGQFDSSYPTMNSEMVQRKIWVKRPGASATLVSIAEDDLVDDLRDQVLRKYANSLGKSYDSPDLLIRIAPRQSSNRHSSHERILSPEEPVCPVIDEYYPGGQTVEEALIIDIPQRRTPKPSPRQSVYYHPAEPGEHGEYFPLMPANLNVGTPPAHPPSSLSSTSGVSTHPTPSISILTTGKAPPLPSPGSRGSRPARRPQFPRHPANSPTIMAPPLATKDPNISTNGQPPQPPPAIPTPPAPAPESPQNKSLTPPARASSPRPARKSKKNNGASAAGAAFGGLIEGTVPPINVLIVEDNVINQKLLEAFMKRLSVRWQCAPNGEVAVKKWRQGGFHLVLMDIQLPVMNGLEATKEIRRLERLNGIGVFSKTASGRSSAASTTASSPGEKRPEAQAPMRQEDVLGDLSLFKSPVIIVALTASSLQSDRHEALAAGCNDFLTKPVGFPWLEQKVTEWGCMQALIDFEGWRKWRGFADGRPKAASSSSNHNNNNNNNQASLSKRSNSVKRNNSVKKSGHASTQNAAVQTGNGNDIPPVPTRPKLPEAAGSSGSGSGSGSGETVDSSASQATCIRRNGEPPGGSSQDAD